ncbi:MAG: hypothetical protein IJS65_03540 [Clostridia bacterium]|nr:hypothetical protein [Clostridia bacterium]
MNAKKLFSQPVSVLLALLLLSSCGNKPEQKTASSPASSEKQAEQVTVSSVAANGAECTDEVCVIPETDENGEQIYPIVSPAGYHKVEQIKQAPRLDTLDGKTLALVGGSFMASVTHAELIRCLREKYPSVKIYSFSEVGSGGPFSVFGQTSQTLSFQEKLLKLKVDAVISGNCGCGLCTTKESGSSIAAEYIGIPAVTVGAPTFIAQIHSTGVNRGVPVLRTAEYPGAFSSHSEEELLKNTREVVFPQIEKALTDPITQPEINLFANDGKRPFDETVYYGTYAEIQEYCLINDYSDGLPVTPPTDALIREYLRFTPYKAEDTLGTIAPAYRECNTYIVAANAVMSGVPKEYMPLCVAFVQCMNDGEWRRPLSSTHGWSPYAWINGPLSRQLETDHGQGMISESANKALGRFIDLAMLNIGGYYVKENRMGTFGYLSAWTFSEDEEACLRVGWDPYHVTQGYGLNTNTLTAASALSWGNNVTPATDDPERIMELLAWDITEKQQNGLGNTNPQVYRTVFITEYVARDLAKLYKTKSSLEDALTETARRPLYMRAYANYWANTGSRPSDKTSFAAYYDKLYSDPGELAALTDVPPWLSGVTDKEKIVTIGTMRKGQTPLLVTGDADRNKFQVMPGGGYVTVKIALPDNWNELVAPMGYAPLEDFYLEKPSAAPETQKSGAAAASAPVSPSGAYPSVSSPAVSPPGASAPALTSAAALPDGVYRLVASEEHLTEAGKVFLDKSGELKFYSGVSSSVSSLPLSSLNGTNAADIVGSLGVNCSFTLSSGRVTEVTLRPFMTERKPVSDLSSLSAETLKDTRVTFAVNVKQSKQAGSVTPAGSSVLLSPTLTSFYVDLSGTPELRDGGTAGYLTLENGHLTVDTSKSAGSSGKIIVKLSGGKYRLLTITAEKDGSTKLAYTTSDKTED